MFSALTRSNLFSGRCLIAISANLVKTYSCEMSKSALLILAAGAEEMESVIIADVLRRGGVSVCIAGLSDNCPKKCSRDVTIVPDGSLEEAKAKKFDVVVLPGGLAGSKALCESPLVGEVLKQQEKENRIVAAICAAPTALAAHGIGLGKNLTSYPAMKDQLTAKYKYVDDKMVVKDGNLITSRGPGTAIQFALRLTQELVGCDKACETAKAMLVDYKSED